MDYKIQIIKLIKKYPFVISYKTRTFSNNIFLVLYDNKFEGLGECDPGFSHTDTIVTEQARLLHDFINSQSLENLSIHEIEQRAEYNNLPKPAQAALDIALWDLLGKKSHQPCFRLFGLKPTSNPTSITLGIIPHEQIFARVQELLIDR